MVSTAAESLRPVLSLPAFHSALLCEFLDSAQCCCRCEDVTDQSKMCDYHAPWLLSSLFQGRASGWLSLGGDFDISSTQPGLLQHLCWLRPCRYLELAAAGLRRSSSSQLLRNTLWGQAGAFQQLYATLSESHNKQAQALLLDFGNCCLRDRFAYKYLLFSLWLFTGETGKKKVSLLLRCCFFPPELILLTFPSSQVLAG